MISYFPTANNLKNISKYGDIIAVKSIHNIPTYWSGNYTLRTNSSTFSNILSYIAAVYLPECSVIGNGTFQSASRLQIAYLPKCTTIEPYAFQQTPISSIYIPNCTSIGTWAFISNSAISEINFPNCTYISHQAFMYCSKLTKIILPKCSSLESGVFRLSQRSPQYSREIYLPECTVISSTAFMSNDIKYINISKVQTLANDVFEYCVFNLSSSIFELPSCTSIGAGAFHSCTLPSTVNLPLVTKIPATCFVSAKVTTINLPNCSEISNAFYNCSNLREISLPLCEKIYGSTISTSATFYYCNLSTISLPKLSVMEHSYVFTRCSQLMSVYLMNSVVCTIRSYATYLFSNSPITNSTYTGIYGSVYVPASLLSSYLSNIYWKSIASRIVGI